MIIPESLEKHRAAFLEMCEVRRYSPMTISGYRDRIKGFFRYMAACEMDEIREVKPETIRAWLVALEERGCSMATRNTYFWTIKCFFEYLEKTQAILIDPCAELSLPQVERRLPGKLTNREVRRLLAEPDISRRKGIRDRAIMELFYSTGIRLSELTALTIYDVDCANGLLRVQKGKGGKTRMVPVGRTAVEMLERYLFEARAVWVGRKGDERALWLSAIRPHGPIKSQTILVMVKTYSGKIGLSVTPHLWRHTFATHLVSNGANITCVQRLLGHASLETTQIYTRLTISELKAAYDRAHPRNRQRGGQKP